MCTGRGQKLRFRDDELVDKTGIGLQGVCFDSAESQPTRECEMLQSRRTRQMENLLQNRMREPEVRNISKRRLSSWRSSSKLLGWKTQSSQLKSGSVPHTNLQPHCWKTKCVRKKTRLVSKSFKRCWTSATNTSPTLLVEPVLCSCTVVTSQPDTVDMTDVLGPSRIAEKPILILVHSALCTRFVSASTLAR